MSHCYSCDNLLTDREAVRKHKITKEEIGLCDWCLGKVEEIVHVPIQEPIDIYSDEVEAGEYVDFGYVEENEDEE